MIDQQTQEDIRKVKKAVENVGHDEVHYVLAHIEAVWAKHLSGFTPGTEIHSLLNRALRELQLGVEKLLGAPEAPVAQAAPEPSAPVATGDKPTEEDPLA